MIGKGFIARMMLFMGCVYISSPLISQEYTADYRVAKEEVLRSIPVEYIHQVKTGLVVAYQHTSHGTHVSRGMFGLQGYKPGDDTLFGLSPTPQAGKLEFRDFAMEDYAPPGVEGVDLSRDETAFIQTTRNYLDAPENATVNVVMWSWSRITGHDVAGNYLPGMDSLINEYGPGGSKIGTGPGQRAVPVTFVYMTGHAIKNENLGPLNPKEQADTIIALCEAHQRFCHDYYTIDTHTMDDVYYEDTGDNGDSDTYGGNFYEDWQNSHTLGVDWYENWQTPEGYVTYGVHTTQHITSNRKAYAMWWILARIAGWDGVIPVSSIQLSTENDTTSVMTGDSLQLYAAILPFAASDTAVAWTVIPGSGTASIDSAGLLRGALPGVVEVVATAMDGSGAADTLELTILDPLVPLTNITISTEGGRVTMDAGTTLQCSASFLPVDASNPEIVWSISPVSGSARIGPDGLVTALGAGTIEVIASAQDGSMVADTLELTIEGSVILVSQIEISTPGGVLTLETGSDLQLSAQVLPAEATQPGVLWSVRNLSGSATITQEGLLSGITAGDVEAIALAQDISGVGDTLTLTIVDNEVLVSSIVVGTAGGNTSMEVGSSLQCTASVLPANATNPSVEWVVAGGTGSASISSAGLVEALGAGTVEVEARAMDGSYVKGSLVLSIQNPVGIPDANGATSVKLYPNPGSGRFYLESQTLIQEIRVFDGLGKEILRMSPPELTSTMSIDLSTNAPGIYGLWVTGMDQTLYFTNVVLVE